MLATLMRDSTWIIVPAKAMGSDLAREAAHYGVILDEQALARFARLSEELRVWNERVNLTAIVEPAEVERRHFLDSLSCLLAIDDLLQARSAGPPSVIDVGSGGGFPGLPLKLARPELRLTLLDSVRKKTRFLEHVIETLGLEGVEVVTGRAETVAREQRHRERYLVAVSRAVASLPTLLELCLPFVRVGGRLVAPRKGDLEAELQTAHGAARKLGGELRPIVPVHLIPGESDRGLVVVQKVRPTPAEYPRREGVPKARPLTQ